MKTKKAKEKAIKTVPSHILHLLPFSKEKEKQGAFKLPCKVIKFRIFQGLNFSSYFKDSLSPFLTPPIPSHPANIIFSGVALLMQVAVSTCTICFIPCIALIGLVYTIPDLIGYLVDTKICINLQSKQQYLFDAQKFT